MVMLQQLPTTSELFLCWKILITLCSNFVSLIALISNYIFSVYKNENIVAALKLFNSQTNDYQTQRKGEMYITEEMPERMAQIWGPNDERSSLQFSSDPCLKSFQGTKTIQFLFDTFEEVSISDLLSRVSIMKC